MLNVLKSKIHIAFVTGANIEYMGSISIDKELMEHAGIIPYEKVLVGSLDNGERLEIIQKYIELQGKEESGQAQLELRKKYYGRKPIDVCRSYFFYQ